MSRQEIRDQAALLKRPGTVVRCVDDGENVVVVLEPFTPPNAEQYTPHKLDALAFIVPSLFPEACPDPSGFYVKPLAMVLTSTGAAPRSTAETPLLGEQWRKFSWAPKTFKWDSDTDTLATHLATIEVRFRKGD
jgi:hypothetical protein